MDSTRYFEFEWIWNRLQRRASVRRYLDISSPRLLPVCYARQPDVRQAILVNPDADDLKTTHAYVEAVGISQKCSLIEQPVEKLRFKHERFDVVTSISVLEHIKDDRAALSVMWDLVEPGGALLISLPCTAVGYEQFREFNEYNLVEPEPDGTFFFQRFYDEKSLRDRIYQIAGEPRSIAVYGERTPGYFGQNADWKMRSLAYPFWGEPMMMASNFKAFGSIDDLPGEGVVALEFEKA